MARFTELSGLIEASVGLSRADSLEVRETTMGSKNISLPRSTSR